MAQQGQAQEQGAGGSERTALDSNAQMMRRSNGKAVFCLVSILQSNEEVSDHCGDRAGASLYVSNTQCYFMSVDQEYRVNETQTKI